MRVIGLLLLVAFGSAAGAEQYVVGVRLLPGDELAAVAKQLAATHGVRIESIAAQRAEIVITASEARARLLSGSPHVVRVDSAAPALTIGPYGYDGSGNVTKIGNDSFVYDSAGRIVSGTAGPNRRQDYTYDSFGNLLTIATDGNTAAQIKLHVDSATNRASTPSPLSPTFNAFGDYDAVGNMTSFGDAGPIVYDGVGMITGATIGGRRTVYLYTPDDERVATITLTQAGTSQWVEGESEWTLRGPDQKILRRFVRNAEGTWTWDEDYIYRESLLLAAEVNRPAKTLRFHLDHLGTRRLITGNGGAEVSRHAYFPFGLEATSIPSPERLKFTGHERDQPNLDYMHARYYNGGWGRFLSVDPAMDIDEAVEEPQLWNRYAYVTNNPLKFTDPDGRYRTFYKEKPVTAANLCCAPPPVSWAFKAEGLLLGLAAAGPVSRGIRATGEAALTWLLGPGNAQRALDAIASPPGSSAIPATAIRKDSVIEGYAVSNHAWRKSGLGRGATEEMVTATIQGSRAAGNVVSEVATGKFEGNKINVYVHNGVKVVVDETRKLILSIRYADKKEFKVK